MQNATIIIGTNNGTVFTGPGSLRAARAAAKGTKAVIRFVRDGVASLIAFDPNGTITASFQNR